MLRWFRRDQERFERTYRQHSLAESASSSMKERFGSVVGRKDAPHAEAPGHPAKHLLQPDSIGFRQGQNAGFRFQPMPCTTR